MQWLQWPRVCAVWGSVSMLVSLRIAGAPCESSGAANKTSEAGGRLLSKEGRHLLTAGDTLVRVRGVKRMLTDPGSRRGALSGVLPAILRPCCPCNWAQQSGLRPGLCPHVPAKMSEEGNSWKKSWILLLWLFSKFYEKKKLVMIQPQIMTKGNRNIALLKIRSGLYYCHLSPPLLKLVSTFYCSLFR